MTSFYRYLFLILTFLYFPIRGKAHRPLGNRPKIWVVINTTANIGDMVCTTPIFRAIKEDNPEARLIVVGIPKNGAILEHAPYVDRYLSSKQSPFALVRELRKEHVDAGVMLNFSMFEFALLFLSGVPSISCFKFKEGTAAVARSYQLVSHLGHEIEYTPGMYVPGQYLNLLKPFGILNTDVRKHLGFSDEGSKHIDALLKEKGISTLENIVAIAPGAGTKVKQWPANRFGEVANHLSKTYGVPIVLIGGPNDVREGENMRSSLAQHVRTLDCIGQSLDELKATLAKVAFIIGNDSGSIYIAESFGKSTLVLVGPTDETEHPLNDRTHRIVKAPERGKALLQSYVKGEDAISAEEAQSQMESITTAMVCREVDSLCDEIHIVRKVEV
jgi:heptosyltransferase II